jgi:hypothetical protein
VTRLRRHAFLVALVVALVFAGSLDRASVGGLAAQPDGLRVIGHGQIRYAGHGPEFWHLRFVQERRRAQTLRADLLEQPAVGEAINLACVVYGHCAELWRKARCESTLGRHLASASSSARGLFMFLTEGRVRAYAGGWSDGGTWATTPFWRFSPMSLYANALAAGWMHANGRGGEWVCQ